MICLTFESCSDVFKTIMLLCFPFWCIWHLLRFLWKFVMRPFSYWIFRPGKFSRYIWTHHEDSRCPVGYQAPPSHKTVQDILIIKILGFFKTLILQTYGYFQKLLFEDRNEVEQRSGVNRVRQRSGVNRVRQISGVNRVQQRSGNRVRERSGVQERSPVDGEQQRSEANGVQQRSVANGVQQRSGGNGVQQRSGVNEVQQRSGVYLEQQRSGVNRWQQRIGVQERSPVYGEQQRSEANGVQQRSVANGVQQRSVANGVQQRSGGNGVQQRSGVNEVQQRSGVYLEQQRSGVNRWQQRIGVQERSPVYGEQQRSGANEVQQRTFQYCLMSMTQPVWVEQDTLTYCRGYPEKLDNQNLCENWLFYSNERKGGNGMLIDQVHQEWLGNYTLLETCHDYIQWLFPTRETSMYNHRAQELQLFEAKRISEDPAARQRVLKSYCMMLDFWGMCLEDEMTGVIVRGNNWQERFWHLNRSSHNYLRITRMLKSLGELGFEHLKCPFLMFILHEVFFENTLTNASESCLHYWIHLLRDEEENRKIKETAQDYLMSITA